MTFFHRERRKVLSQTILDIFKLTTVAAFVSGFFTSFSLRIRLIIAVLLFVLLLLGFAICPTPKGDD